MKKRQTPRGAGYTVRVGGRKYLTATLLEEQVEAAQQQLMELLKQNEVLRSKEALHLEALEISEAVLHQLGVVAHQPAPGTKQHAKWLEAVQLDMQALTLKEELQLNPFASTPQGSQAPSAGPLAASTHAASDATCSRSTSSSATADASSGVSSSSSGSGNGRFPSRQHRVTRMLASLTPEEIMQFKGLSVAEVADRLRAAKNGLARARVAAIVAGLGDTPELEQAVLAFARLTLVSYVSDEVRHCQIVGLNFDTMVTEAMPEHTFRAYVAAAQLQPEQVQQLCMAYRVYSQIEGPLMQRQQQIMQELQDVLGPGLAACLATPGAAASALPQADDTAAASRQPSQLAPGQPGVPPATARTLAGGADTAAAAAAGLLAAQLPAQACDRIATLPVQGPSLPAVPQQAAALLAAGVPARLLSPQLQMLLQIRAKSAAAAAAEGATGSNTGPGAGSTAGSGSCPLEVSSGSAVPPSAAGTPHMPVTGISESYGSRSDQQLPLTGDALLGQGSGSCGVSGSFSSSSTSVHMPGRAMGAQKPSTDEVLALDASEKVEAVLERFERVAWSLKHNGRKLGTLFMNILSASQYADICVTAWPYFVSPLRLCLYLMQENPDL